MKNSTRSGTTNRNPALMAQFSLSRVLIFSVFVASCLAFLASPALAHQEGNGWCDFELHELSTDVTTANDIEYMENCWELLAKNVSAETYHSSWWYYPHEVTYGFWSSWNSKAAESWNVTVANYGKVHYCTYDSEQVCDQGYEEIGWYVNNHRAS